MARLKLSRCDLLLSGCLISYSLLVAAVSNAAPPELKHFYPAGAARGQSLTVTAGGTFSKWPVQAWIDQPGLEVEAAEKKGELEIRVAEDAQAGLYWIRLHNGEGASSLKPFIVGLLPEATEEEPNDAYQAEQTHALPKTMNGRLEKREDVDTFAVELHEGEKLIAAVDAHHLLSSPMDAVLQVCDPHGFVLEQNDDSRGIDPQLTFVVPRDGTYLVRVFAFPETPTSSISFAGDADFIYRLTLTTGPYADHSLPLAVQRGVETPVQLAGWNLDGESHSINIEAVEGEENSFVALDGVASHVELSVQDHRVVSVITTNDDAVTEIPVPVTVSGRLATDGAVARFRFQASPEKTLRMRLAADRLGYLLDGVLTIHDESGKQLVQVDDADRQRDPEITFKPPQAGWFELQVSDLYASGGLRHVYRLTIEEEQPGFELKLSKDAVAAAAGASVEIPLEVERIGGFDQPIEIRAVELPAGVQLEELTVPAKTDDAKKKGKTETVQLKLVTAPDAQSGPLRFIGESASHPAVPVSFSLANGDRRHTAAWLTVQPK